MFRQLADTIIKLYFDSSGVEKKVVPLENKKITSSGPETRFQKKTSNVEIFESVTLVHAKQSLCYALRA